MNDRDIEDTRQPKDEPEAVYCDDCGEEMSIKRIYLTIPNDFTCTNPYCPKDYYGIAREMAEVLLHETEIRKKLELRVKFLSDRLKIVDPNWK